MKKCFRRSIKKARDDQKEKILDKLQLIEDKNPTEFWNLINKIKSKKANKENIDPELFLEYFRSLHKPNKDKRFDNKFARFITDELKLKGGKIDVDVLDKSITEKEIMVATKLLKNRKASGYDSISNEMIKYSIHIMKPILVKLFNAALHSEYFPKCWTEGYIVPIHKSGDELDPSNYRGITISNCIGKLFTRIMNTRLLKFIDDENMIKHNQIGFMPKHRTSDHILVLKTLIDCFKNAKKSLYLCFVDLKKAFDTVYHEGLIYKLKQLHFSTKFINIIKSMYSKVTARVKTLNGLTEEFPISIGTRQGCNLSPLLFNLYINDLPGQLMCKERDVVKVGNTELKCLMYADDIVLLNKTEHGMNLYLNQLEQYCNKWRLRISVQKTKILIINNKTPTAKFMLYKAKLDIVDTYCYLGIMISNTGTFKKAINHLLRKASNAYFSIRKEFNFYNNTSPKVLLKLFDSMIRPILLYGCEVWGVFEFRKSTADYLKKYLLSVKHTFESLHTKMCKNVLGVNRNATELLVKAELGRYPMMCNIVQCIYSYWQHIQKSSPTSMVRKVILENTRHNVLHYSTRVTRLFEAMQCKHLLQIKITKHCDVKRYCKNVRLLYQNMYKQYFFDILKEKEQMCQSAGRFEVYVKVKKQYTFEKYLLCLRNNLRRNITNIRISTSILPVEILRKRNVKREDRICPLCTSKEICTELHATMYCTNNVIVHQREQLDKKLAEITPQWQYLTKELKFVHLTLANDKDMIFYFAIFLDKIMKEFKAKHT